MLCAEPHIFHLERLWRRHVFKYAVFWREVVRRVSQPTPGGSEPRMTMLSRASSNFTRQRMSCVFNNMSGIIICGSHHILKI
jgi:hypothetical protein